MLLILHGSELHSWKDQLGSKIVTGMLHQLSIHNQLIDTTTDNEETRQHHSFHQTRFFSQSRVLSTLTPSLQVRKTLVVAVDNLLHCSQLRLQRCQLFVFRPQVNFLSRGTKDLD